MRFTRNLDGLRRIKECRKKHKNLDNDWYYYYYYYSTKVKREENQDTKIRKDINTTIIKMIDEGKNDIQIEIYLKELYPSYLEYILKMISYQFSKINTSKEVNSRDEKTGEER